VVADRQRAADMEAVGLMAAALDAVPLARDRWDAFPPGARRQMLWWVISAVRSQTRAQRIARVVEEAAEGRRRAGLSPGAGGRRRRIR